MGEPASLAFVLSDRDGADVDRHAKWTRIGIHEGPLSWRIGNDSAESGRCAGGSRVLPSLSRATPSAASEHCSELLGCPISRSLTTSCVRLELRSRPSPGITRLHRYNGPLRLPRAPSLSLTGVWLVIPDHALGPPVLRALSLCTCCRHYPGAAVGRIASLIHPAVSAFPDNPVGSACASSFSRFARRSLALRPAHSRCHRIS